MSTIEYRIVRAVGAELPNGNPAFAQVEREVMEALLDGWEPIGGVSIAAVVGPHAEGSGRDNWHVRVAQALIRKPSA